jgi:NAD(P)H-hydrate epimerase
MVLDADALNHLGSDLAPVADAAGPVVLTPHPGEAARLLGVDSGTIERDRLAAVRELAARSGAVVVLKGARSLVCNGLDAARRGLVAINPTGGPALATAGSGDILTGIIGALLAQGLAPFDAALLGTYLHGLTGEHAAHALASPHAVTAADLPEHLGPALATLDAHRAR